MFELTKLDSIKIGLASPEKIREWSRGEVTKAETINYRTLKPERDGLFCERIFGPTKDWECNCGKYKRTRFKGIVCDKCGVEVTKSKVRRERMGHIELAAPVSHIWYFKGIPSRMGTLLEISPRALEQVLYFANYIVLDEGDSAVTKLQKYQLLTENEYQQKKQQAAAEGFEFRVGIGAEAVREMLQKIDLNELSAQLKAELEQLNERETKKDSEGQKRQRIIKRLEVVEAFRQSGNKPEWMVLDVVPVIPPELRPMVQLDGGRFATADLNDLYRRVINRNNRLKKMLEMQAPDIIVRNEKRMLQEAVDALIDNGRRGRPVTGAGGRQLKSLSDLLRGKQGRFRQNLLGKRVDYSGRSVIVVGPSLKLYQCGLPKEMALELFKPFVIEKLVKNGLAANVKAAKRSVERLSPAVWDVLESVIKDHPVMLNRAPTLHRLGIQAFEPVLVEGKALKLHPLCCTAFNADFDGDQMAVHVPLSMEAQAEARFLMLAANNILKPSDGKPVICPTQDMVLGCYYVTMINENNKGVGSYYADVDESLMAYGTKALHIEAPAFIRMCKKYSDDEFMDIIGKTTGMREYNVTSAIDSYDAFITPTYEEKWAAYEEKKAAFDALGEDADEGTVANAKKELNDAKIAALTCRVSFERQDGFVECRKVCYTTVGRLIFNNVIPQDMGWQPRETIDDMFRLEIDQNVGKKQLAKIVDSCYRTHDVTTTANVLDAVKALGYKYSTRAALTVSVSDIIVPQQKYDILTEAERNVQKIEKMYKRGLMSENERYSSVIKIWETATDEVTSHVKNAVSKNPFNPINMMADSGARGSINQIRQLSGMRGLMASPTGKIIELPIKSNFREGLSVLEFFLSSHGSRKSLADTAMKTADSGYMTRRLVDVSQENVIREIDCFANRNERVRGLKVKDIGVPGDIIESLEDRITGRVAAEDIIHPETGEVLVECNELITHDLAQKVLKAGITEVTIRTVLTCQCGIGVCAKCYGANMTNGRLVDIGEAVGIIAAQSIGEPGTQLTMRTFHTGGVAGGEDITQGLPRVEELFEARRPKREATLAEISGTVSIKQDSKKRRKIVIQSNEDAEVKEYPINFGSKLRVEEGAIVSAGDQLIEGSVNPHDLLRILGVRAVQDYIVQEVQATYRRQGVDITDKHIEVIVRQMLRKVRIEDANDTDLLPGSLVDIFRFDQANRKALEEGMRPATAKRVLLGITKAALATESFMSAASFQETTRVLTEAAIKGKSDPLLGLKENVIIGKQIPAGTGLRYYSDIAITENY